MAQPDKDIPQDDAVDQESRRDAEGNEVGKRIEFAPEWAFDAAHAGHAAIEQIKNAGQQDEHQAQFDLLEVAGREVGLDDFGQGDKAAEEVAGGEEVGQKVNLELRLGGFGGRRAGGGVRHNHEGFTQIPPERFRRRRRDR